MFEFAENTLPKGICPLIKSSYGYAVSDRCPYFYFSDVVVGETTCDGKKKMYEMLSEFKEVFVLQLPNFQTEDSLMLWKNELLRFKHYLEDKFQVVITEEMLREAVKRENRRRNALKNFYGLMKLDPVPIMGKDLLDVLYGNKYQFDMESAIKRLDALREQILEEYQEKKPVEKRPRILLTGCPIGGDSAKVVAAIEDNGGVVVAFENCTGAKTVSQLVDESDPDVLEAIARKYLGIGCAIMTPNDNRIELLGEMIDEFKVDGVVEMSLTGCHSVQMEAISVKNFVNEEKHIPYLDVLTDYSMNDISQLRTRAAAFIEMLRDKL